MKKQPIPFGKYFLLERINIGGMAEVWKAKTYGVEGFERISAIKRILPNIAEDEEFITMFIDEAKISVQLTHANVAQIYDLGKIQDSYFIAMEYISGKDLRGIFDRMRKKGEVVPIPMTCYIMSRVCEGLDYAHRKKDAQGRDLGIVHRDVSPQNVLISFEGEVKVIDFGIAKAANKATKTQAGILKGKFGYMSPEQVRGLPLDRRSDVFAIGVVLYEMLTGERLFVGESDFSTLEKVRNVDILPPTTYNRRIPEPLERIVLKSLAKDVEDRYQWANELQDDLQRFLITSDAIFSRKDLAQYMKSTFAEDVEREKIKMAEAAEFKLPAHMTASNAAAVAAPSSDPVFASPPPVAAAPPTPGGQRAMGSNPGSRAPARGAPSPGTPRPSYSSPPVPEGTEPNANDPHANADLFNGGPDPFGGGAGPNGHQPTMIQPRAAIAPPAPARPVMPVGPPPGFGGPAGGPPRVPAALPRPIVERVGPAVVAPTGSPAGVAQTPPRAPGRGAKSRRRGLFLGVGLGLGGLVLLGAVLAFLNKQGILGSQARVGDFAVTGQGIKEIKVDGRLVASGGPFVGKLPTGEHKVVVTGLDGSTNEKKITVISGERAEVNVSFAAAAADVRVVIVPLPIEAEVELDGRNIKKAGPGAPPAVEIEPGMHVVVVKAPGFRSASKAIDVKPGEKFPPVTIELEKEEGGAAAPTTPDAGAGGAAGKVEGATAASPKTEPGAEPPKAAAEPPKAEGG